jgi:hypothetical protein
MVASQYREAQKALGSIGRVARKLWRRKPRKLLNLLDFCSFEEVAGLTFLGGIYYRIYYEGQGA